MQLIFWQEACIKDGEPCRLRILQKNGKASFAYCEDDGCGTLVMPACFSASGPGYVYGFPISLVDKEMEAVLKKYPSKPRNLQDLLTRMRMYDNLKGWPPAKYLGVV